MLPIRVGWLFCGLALGYAVAVLHRGRVDKYNQHTTEIAARVAKRVAAIGKRGTARHPWSVSPRPQSSGSGLVQPPHRAARREKYQAEKKAAGKK